MKSKIFTIVLLLSFGACTQKQSDQLSQQQKDQIRTELRTVVDSMIATSLKLDADAGLQFYWDSPEFLAINPDGSQCDFQALKKMGIEGVKTIASMTLSTSHADISVYAKDLALCTWIGKGEVVLKSGDKMTYDPDALTLLFRKIDGKWKIAYSHESAAIANGKAKKS
ncbi:MAG TPA: DUF3804 family protein [Bacteroidota bacterium]|nr:DUF3804 family protein [Bacteroidota bacterium]